MNKLYLLRHAEAPSAFNLSDKERPLSAHGISQATNVAAHLGNIDLVLCSSAVRTRMTYQVLVEAGAEFGDVEYLDELYNAPASDLLNMIQSSTAKNILLIAHNPGIHNLAVMVMGNGDADKTEKLSLFYNPATLSVFDCNIESWPKIQPNKNNLVDLVIPD